MGFRKFGQSEDQTVALDHEKDELARRTAAADKTEHWTQRDQEELLQETREK